MLTSAQIVTRACQRAKCPSFTSQGGQYLNVVLADLCVDYDFDIAKGTYVFNFNPSLTTSSFYPNVTPGGGPYPLPADFLRMVDEKDATWYLNGVPYPMIPCDLSEYDNLVQQAGLSSFPYIFATDMSQTPPNLLVYPPPSGGYQALIRYRRQMPDIGSGGTANGWSAGALAPETSSVVPWFPKQSYLIKKTTALLMGEVNDDRRANEDTFADADLMAYLKMKDDSTNRSKRVVMDRRRFGSAFARLPSTKQIWG